MKLNVKACALTCGTFAGVGVFLFIWKFIAFGGAFRRNMLLGQFFHGLRVTPLWSVVGLVWGFLEGSLLGALFAWVYNRMEDVFEGGKQEDRHHHRRREEHEHAPWLFALAHRVPHIHA